MSPSDRPNDDLPDDPLVALALLTAVVDLVSAVIELGTPLEDAQALLGELALAVRMAGDACVLVQYGDATGGSPSGWQDAALTLTDDQLAAAAHRGAAFEQDASGLSLFQRIESLASHVHALGQCIDAVACRGWR
jgi:hypothetical protein